MKRVWILWAAFVCSAGFPALSVASGYQNQQWTPGSLLVNFRPEAGDLNDTYANGKAISVGLPSVDALLAKYELRSLRRVVDDQTLNRLTVIPDLYRLVCLTCPAETNILQMMDDFKRNPYVAYAEPDLLRPVQDRIPNDPFWASEFDKRQMTCPRAWDFTTGSDSIIIAAVDMGVYWQDLDFYDNLWVNPGEDLDHDGVPYTDPSYPGDLDDVNGVDDDGDGKVDDFIAWDFITRNGGCAPGEDCDGIEDNDPSSISDHGTNITSIIGAVGNNQIGIAGATWNARLISVRAGFVDTNYLSHIDVLAAVRAMLWAVGRGARIINMSYGSPMSSAAESTAVAACWNNGAILCASVGDGMTPIYPAGYPNVVGVGSVDDQDRVSSFSYYGPVLDCFAPGENVPAGGTFISGTSAACANASGVFALVWSLFPHMTNQQLMTLVLDHCQNIDSQNPNYPPGDLGYGRIDAAAPIASVFPYLTLESFLLLDDNDGDRRLEPGESGNLVITLHNELGWHTGQNIHVALSTADPGLVFADSTVDLGNIPPGASVGNADTPFQITASPNYTEPRLTAITVSISGSDSLRTLRTFNLPIGRPPVLLVADDGADDFHQYYADALSDSAGSYRYDVCQTATQGEPTWIDIREYPVIVWVCGNQQSNTLTDTNRTLLGQYLDAGGRLMLAGQYIDPDISQTPFYHDYLHCASGGTGGARLTGIAGDPISDGTTLLLQGGTCAGNGSLHPSKIIPTDGAIPIYTYPDSGVGAIRYADSAYKVVYFAFALEAACGLQSTTRYDVVIRNTLEWVEGTSNEASEPRATPVAHAFALCLNYPNPFNPVTHLRYSLAQAGSIELSVRNILGQRVCTLHDGFQTAGDHQAVWDASAFPSGMYFATLKAGRLSQTQKLMLIK